MTELYASMPLTQGKSTLVDLDCLHFFEEHKWRAHRGPRGNWYVRSQGPRKNGRAPDLYLHKMITEVPKGMFIDHKNGDGLDNRRDNLRTVTHSQNMMNRRKLKASASIYKGLYRTAYGNWGVAIRYGGMRVYLGTYSSEIEAAKVYDYAAMLYHGEFALLNFPVNGDL